MGAAEIEEYLTYLAVNRNVAASTQNQALSALLFLYQNVLKKDLERPVDAVRAKKPKRLPTVLTKEEAQQVLAAMSGTHQLIAKLLYGSGLRLIECLRLRVKDVDFDQRQIIVRDGKGAKDRVTVLPDSLVELLRKHLVQELLGHKNVKTTMIYTGCRSSATSSTAGAWPCAVRWTPRASGRSPSSTPHRIAGRLPQPLLGMIRIGGCQGLERFGADRARV